MYCYWHRLDRTSPADQARLAIDRQRNINDPDSRVALVGPNKHLSRECDDCKTVVPLWYGTGKQKFRCKPCAKIRVANTTRRRVYGVEPERATAVMETQSGQCAICGCNPRTRALATEHDHRTGDLRGFCCSDCNHKLLGGAHDSLRRLKRAVIYLEHPPAQDPEGWLRAIRELGI